MPLYNPPSSTTIPDPFSRTTISASYMSSSQITASNISTDLFTFTSLNGNGSGLTDVTAIAINNPNIFSVSNAAGINFIESLDKQNLRINVNSGSLILQANSGSSKSSFLPNFQSINIVESDQLGNTTSSLTFDQTTNKYELTSSQNFSYKSPQNTIYNIVPCYKIYRLDTSTNFTVNPTSGSLYFVKTTTSLTGSFINGTIDGQQLKVYNSGSNTFLLTSNNGNPDYELTYTGWNLLQNQCITFTWDSVDSKWRQLLT
jgi:hypothetical protein